MGAVGEHSEAGPGYVYILVIFNATAACNVSGGCLGLLRDEWSTFQSLLVHFLFSLVVGLILELFFPEVSISNLIIIAHTMLHL